MEIKKLKINGMKNPVGYDFSNLRVSWQVAGTEAEIIRNTKIEAAEDAFFQHILFEKQGNLNQTGEIITLELLPRTRYYVRVSAEGEHGENTVSEVAFFETAKMQEAWTGTWIKPREDDRFHPVFHKKFKLKGEKQKVEHVRLYICGLGMYQAFVNGKQAGNEVLTPYYNDYHTRVQYQTFNITDHLKKWGKEEHEIQVLLGNGWYKGTFGLAHKNHNFGTEFMMLAEIHVLYEDGSEEIIGTDETWEYCGSEIESSGIYDGEVINHLLWDGQENGWKKPLPAMPEGKLVPRCSLPVVEKEDMPVREIIKTPAGETVLDFGQNFAGYVVFQTFLAKGTKIVLDFGEILQDGNFYNKNYREAKSQFVYISDGREELVKPHFTFFGFRYVRVSGWQCEISKDDFMGKAVYSDMERTGFMETGNEKVNRLYLNALWGQKSNSIDFPTDCPQRDERLGWTGDAQVFSGTASYNMDTETFYGKFLQDLRDEQQKYDGIVPGVIPVLDPNGPIFSSVWGDIATFLPMVLFEHSGDLIALESHYPMMKDWVDKITREDKARGQQFLYNFGNQLGDWLALDGRTEQSMNGGTDEYFIGSCYYAMSALKTAQAAEVLGKTEDGVYYRTLYEHIKDAVIREYYTQTGRLAIDSQTGYIVALYSGIYPDRERVKQGLRTRLYKDCYKMKGGFVGAPLLCRVLAENGMQEEAFYFLLQEGYPGWLHCVNLGATTIWERWNSVLDDGHLSGTMMNSLNHYAYGAVVEFLYRDVAGLSPAEPGFKKILYTPMVNAKLKTMKASYECPYGTWRSEWEIRSDGKVHVVLDVPFGCTAVVGLPFYPAAEIGEVHAGTHRFDYQPTEDLRARYSKQTMFKDMMQDEKAQAIIERVSPLLGYFLGSGNEDFLYESLDTLEGMSYMGFQKEEIEKLTKELTEIYD